MPVCTHCNRALTVTTGTAEELAAIVAYETTAGLEWAHVACEAASLRVAPAAVLSARVYDDGTYLSVRAMESALDAENERAYALTLEGL
jgi:hypothetical protein